MGAVSGDIPAISEGSKRLAHALVGQLFKRRHRVAFESMRSYADPELLGDEWGGQPADY